MFPSFSNAFSRFSKSFWGPARPLGEIVRIVRIVEILRLPFVRHSDGCGSESVVDPRLCKHRAALLKTCDPEQMAHLHMLYMSGAHETVGFQDFDVQRSSEWFVLKCVQIQRSSKPFAVRQIQDPRVRIQFKNNKRCSNRLLKMSVTK